MSPWPPEAIRVWAWRWSMTSPTGSPQTTPSIVRPALKSVAKPRGRPLAATTAEGRVIQLDVMDPGSIAGLANHLISAHGGVDIVASNAAARAAKDRAQAAQERDFVATNNHGSRNLYGALEPLLTQNARYVIVASAIGQLSNLPENLHPFFDIDRLAGLFSA